jgi:hypothetical protein
MLALVHKDREYFHVCKHTSNCSTKANGDGVSFPSSFLQVGTGSQKIGTQQNNLVNVDTYK